ncbi:MAG: hypothetical protein HY660_04240 [Armatimonadetes bacterium]|nr:hypothetical protein [Armatimonadota bacterium]
MIVNCSRCHRLTRATPQGLCPDCQRREDQELDGVLAYMHTHAHLSAGDLSKGTGVPIERILRWVRDGRLLATRSAPPTPPSSSGPAQPAAFHSPPARRQR